MKKFKILLIIIFTFYIFCIGKSVKALTLPKNIKVSEFIENSINKLNDKDGIDEIGVVYWKNTDNYCALYNQYFVGSVTLQDGVIIANYNNYRDELNYDDSCVILTKVDFEGNFIWRKIIRGHIRDWFIEYSAIYGSNNWFAINMEYSLNEDRICYIFDKDGNEIDKVKGEIIGSKSIGDGAILFGMEGITKISENGKVEWQQNVSLMSGIHGMPDIKLSDNYIYANYYDVYDYDGNKVNINYREPFYDDGVNYDNYDDYYDYNFSKYQRPLNKDGSQYSEYNEILDFSELNKNSIVNIIGRTTFLYDEYGNENSSKKELYLQIIASDSGRIKGEYLLEECDESNFWNFQEYYRGKTLFSKNNKIYLLEDNIGITIKEYHLEEKNNGYKDVDYIISEYDSLNFNLDDGMIRDRGPKVLENGLLIYGSIVIDLKEGIRSNTSILGEDGNNAVSFRLPSFSTNKLTLTNDYIGNGDYCIYIYDLGDSINDIKLSRKIFNLNDDMINVSKIYGNNFIYILDNFENQDQKDKINCSILDPFGEKSENSEISKNKAISIIEESEKKKINIKDYKNSIGEEHFYGEDPYVAAVRGVDGFYVCTYTGRVIKYDFSWNIVGENSEEQYKMGYGYIDIDTTSVVVTYEDDEKNEKGYEQVVCITDDGLVVDYIFPLKEAKVIASYFDWKTAEELVDKDEIDGYVGKQFKTEDKITEINGKYDNKYEFLKVEEKDSGKMTEDTIYVNYYYQKKKGSIEVNYLELDTNNILSEQIIKTGIIDDDYTTENKLDIINEINNNRYNFVKVEGNTEGKYTLNKQVITYYYKRKPAQLKIKYIDEQTGEELIIETLVKGLIGDLYETKLKQIDGYELIIEKIPSNKDGKLTEEDIEIIYYYRKIEDNTEINNDNNIEIDDNNSNVNTSDINILMVITIFVISFYSINKVIKLNRI